ncbi:hypothetical protein [Dongshaea marina]|uniref:hypothetical protein n=1 Tax=Dongshaea marina TaxID=2047966 RepID=UPI000D3E6020|nr:hypothetical protein [Dongshaea marina]
MENVTNTNSTAAASGINSDLTQGAAKSGDVKKFIDNMIDDLKSLMVLVNKALQIIRESIQEWRDALSNSQAKGMMLVLNQAVDNNKMQHQANEKERDAAYTASWGDFAKGIASMLGGGLGVGAEVGGSVTSKIVSGVSKGILDGAAGMTKFGVDRGSAEISRDAKDKSADVQLQNKVIETLEKQIGQTGQRLNEMQGQLSSINDQLRQSVGQLNYSLAQQ